MLRMPLSETVTPVRIDKTRAGKKWRVLSVVTATLALLLSPIAVAPASAAAAPSASNTGIPDGTTTKKHYGDIVITKDGTVINGLEVFGFIRVEAANVTIKNTVVRGRSISSANALIYARSSKVVNLQIKDVTLAAAKASPYINGIYGHHYTLRRVEIRGVIDSAQVLGDKVNIYDSWLHDNLHYNSDPTWGGRPSHDDNIQVQYGKYVNIVNNTISGSHNAALMVTQDSGDVAQVKFTGNRVSGGACTLNVAEKRYGTIYGMSITGNTFGSSSGNCNMIIDRNTRAASSIGSNVRTDGKRITLMTR